MCADRRAKESTAAGTRAGTAARSVLRDVELCDVDFLVPSALEGIDASHTLHRHRSVGEAEGLQRLGIGKEGILPFPKAAQDLFTARNHVFARIVETGDLASQPLLLLLDPDGVVVDEA